MMPRTPQLCTRKRKGSRLLWATQGFWGLLCIGSLAVLVVSRVLVPESRGLGTHTQLGLPACGFLALTSLPCPACGLTTAFAHTARLELVAALRVHVLGPPLFLLTVFLSAWSLRACLAASPIVTTMKRLHLDRALAIIGTVAGLGWLIRISTLL